jgi:isopenicillin N synthase-like dioxygenase
MADDDGQATLPIIDVAPLLGGDPAGVKKVAAEIGAACRHIGFFYIVGHGVSPGLMADVYAQSRAFFAQPAEIKEALSITRSLDNHGYAGPDTEALDPGEAVDAKEAFNLGREASEGGRLGRWPPLAAFPPVMIEYDEAMRRLCERLHMAFAVDLGLAPDFFASAIDRPMAVLRLLHYPPASPETTSRVGAGEHTDYGNITILAQDDVGGLEVRTRAGRWTAARPIEGAFICNIGDCLMRWSNDTYVSTPHRVASPERDRFSVAFFFDANPDALVECLPGCDGPDRPALYPPILAGDYLRSRLDATYDFRRKAPA